MVGRCFRVEVEVVRQRWSRADGCKVLGANTIYSHRQRHFRTGVSTHDFWGLGYTTKRLKG